MITTACANANFRSSPLYSIAAHIASIANTLDVLSADLYIASFTICFPYTHTLCPFFVLPAKGRAPPALGRRIPFTQLGPENLPSPTITHRSGSEARSLASCALAGRRGVRFR